MSDKDKWYDIWEDGDKPDADQGIVLQDAALRSRKYNLDKRIYIVRGYDMFVVHADDIQVVKNGDGTRAISIKNGRMVKYGEDGKRQADT